MIFWEICQHFNSSCSYKQSISCLVVPLYLQWDAKQSTMDWTSPRLYLHSCLCFFLDSKGSWGKRCKTKDHTHTHNFTVDICSLTRYVWWIKFQSQMPELIPTLPPSGIRHLTAGPALPAPLPSCNFYNWKSIFTLISWWLRVNRLRELLRIQDKLGLLSRNMCPNDNYSLASSFIDLMTPENTLVYIHYFILEQSRNFRSWVLLQMPTDKSDIRIRVIL